MSDNIKKARERDWSRYLSPHMPREGVVYLTGKTKADMIARVEAAFAKLKRD